MRAQHAPPPPPGISPIDFARACEKILLALEIEIGIGMIWNFRIPIGTNKQTNELNERTNRTTISLSSSLGPRLWTTYWRANDHKEQAHAHEPNGTSGQSEWRPRSQVVVVVVSVSVADSAGGPAIRIHCQRAVGRLELAWGSIA